MRFTDFSNQSQMEFIVAKFYVQSGTMRTVVQAESSRKAALWAVHQAMQQVLPMEDDPGMSTARKSENVSRDGVAVLSQRVKVSEQGFDREDSACLPTMEVVTEWNDLVATLNRLEQMLYRAA